MRQGMRPRGERPQKQEKIKKEPEDEIKTDIQNGPPIFKVESERVTKEIEQHSEVGVSGVEVPETAFQGLPPEARIHVPEMSTAKEKSFAEQIAEDAARHNANLAAEKQKKDAPEVGIDSQPAVDAVETTSVQKTSPKPSGTGFSFKRLGERIAGLFKRKEAAQPPEQEVPVIDKEKLKAARALKIELPEKPSSDEIREALIELVGRLPELQEIGGGMFKDGAPIMRSLRLIDANSGERLGYYDPAAAFIDTRVIQDVLSENSKELQEQYPERSELYAQLNRLARSFGYINNQKTKRGQLIGNTEIAHGILKDDVMRRLDYDLKYNPPDEVVYPPNGEVTFTDEERAAIREANPEVAELHEKIRLEAEMMAGDDELGKEIEAAFDTALKSHEESLPQLPIDALEEIVGEPGEISPDELKLLPEERIPGIGGISATLPADALPRRVEHIVPLEKKGELVLKRTEGVLPAVKEMKKPLSVREKHGSVRETTMLAQVRKEAINAARMEVARIQEQITGKETRIATQFQWWKFGESTRTARAATKEAIVKLQEQLKAQSWKLSDLLNADKLATREQMVQYSKPERQKKKRYSQKTKDYQKRTDRKAS
ncbi:MAG: hypothetical protein P8J32_08155 [bacterium]|jgi:hypothetical protein|nr:hypothetical protein [bacterium]